MSKRFKESLSESEFKSKLNRMGISLDRTYHPLNYYKQMYYEKSNAKNKITRNNTPFYREIINKKRQRSSSKKNKQKKNLDYDDINEEEEEEINNIIEPKGIKTTRLIESNKKKMQKKTEEKNVFEENIISKNKSNKLGNKEKEKKENISNSYNLRNKSEALLDEKNIIRFGAQSDNTINNNTIIENKPQKDYILDVNENNKNIKKEVGEKPEKISKIKMKLKRQNAIINNEEEKDAYNSVEDNDNKIFIYEDSEKNNYNNKEINKNEIINNNEINKDSNMIEENIEEKNINSLLFIQIHKVDLVVLVIIL